MLSQANTLTKLAAERAKADAERDPGYQQRDWERLEAGVRRTQSSIEPGSDRAGLRYFLLEAAKLPDDQRIAAVDQALAATGARGAEAQVDALLARLYAGTQIADLAARLDMFDDTPEQLAARDDAMLELAAALRPLLDADEQRDREIEGARARLEPQYVAELEALRGGRLAPDANGTLRFTFGHVRGYEPRDGVVYEPQTTIAGVLAKNTGKEPFDSPRALVAAARAGRFEGYADPDLGTLPVDFLSTADITNGNSGSAVMNARGELIGLAFDGNYEAMGSDYLFDPEVGRTIAVDARYMLWVMDAVDHADRLLEEMGLPVRYPTR